MTDTPDKPDWCPEDVWALVHPVPGVGGGHEMAGYTRAVREAAARAVLADREARTERPLPDEVGEEIVQSIFGAIYGTAGVDGRLVSMLREEADGTARLAAKAILPIITRLSRSEAEKWACAKCNAPRSVNPCPKCGTPLTKPADGWHWPGLPDIERIRTLAREVGYAIGVHGSLERDLDLIAVPWVADAVEPMVLAEHIANGLSGEVLDYKTQDKPCGRWSCNIHTPDWTKMIDLSVMPPMPDGSGPFSEPDRALEGGA